MNSLSTYILNVNELQIFFFFLNHGMSKAHHNFFRFYAEVVSEINGDYFTTFCLLNTVYRFFFSRLLIFANGRNSPQKNFSRFSFFREFIMGGLVFTHACIITPPIIIMNPLHVCVRKCSGAIGGIIFIIIF